MQVRVLQAGGRRRFDVGPVYVREMDGACYVSIKVDIDVKLK